jgi:hypothetical protein
LASHRTHERIKCQELGPQAPLETLRYTSSGGLFLHGYADIDWAGSPVDRKSTSGYYFSLGSAMISWSSRKQGSIAQSTAEAEYIAASDASKEAVWLRKLISGLFGDKLETTVVHYVKFGSIDSHSPMRGHMGHPEASQGDLENQSTIL